MKGGSLYKKYWFIVSVWGICNSGYGLSSDAADGKAIGARGIVMGNPGVTVDGASLKKVSF